MAKLRLGDPTVVSLAPKDCQKWGQWQFPALSPMRNGGIALTYSVGQDSAGGAAFRRACSMDGGRTWQEVQQFPSPNGLLLPGGDTLRPMTCPAIPADALCLPTAEKAMLLDVVNYDFHRVETFPGCFRGRWLQRCGADGIWHNECKRVDAPGEYIVVTWDDLARHPFGSPGKWICPQRVDRLALSPDGEIWMMGYYHSALGEYPYYGSALFVSQDEGHTFHYRSQLVYDGTFDPPAHRRNPRWRTPEGFCEPAIAFLPDGTALCLMRTDTFSSSFIARSRDGGRTWSRPEEFDGFGVLPDMERLENGVLLAVYGRPGVRLRATSDPDARIWDEPIDVLTDYDSSCSNCTLLPIASDAALLAYSDFHYPAGSGGFTKAILVRRVEVRKD